MSMSKKDFVALADTIREHNEMKRRVFGVNAERMCFNVEQIDALADFCRSQNGNFMRERWLDYITGKCGKNGGKVAA
jgi:hypothetical protein